MSKRLKLSSLLVAVLITGAAVAYVALQDNQHVSHSTDSLPVTPTPSPTPQIDSITTKLLFSGDVFWSRATDFWAQNSPEKHRHPFAQLDSFNADQYHAWVANLECPITDTPSTRHQQEVELKFNCPIEYTQYAAEYFDIFSLATNHTDNQEEVDGFAQTKQHLAENGIEYFGHFDNKRDEICKVIKIKSSGIDINQQELSQPEIPIAFCGYHYVFRLPTEGEIEEISSYAQSMPTIAIPHMGQEYTPEPDQLKTTVYHRMIDAGAIAVIGSHPHWVQNTEVYNQRLIAYSLGNFIFDQRWHEELTKGAALGMSMSFDGAKYSEWLTKTQSCQEFDQSCLESLQPLYNPTTIAISYQPFSVDSTTQQTRRGDAQLDSWLRQRLRWDETLSQLN